MHAFRAVLSSLVLLTLTATTGFGADPTDAERLKESLTKWEKARDACGGDYSYQVCWSSFVGFGNVTTVTVKDNKVVERKFVAFQRGQNANELEPKWVETGKEIGSHKAEGAPARTVDELYAEAKKLVDKETPDNHKRYLGIDKEGLLSYCFLRDTRIADDAPMTGIQPFQLQLKSKK